MIQRLSASLAKYKCKLAGAIERILSDRLDEGVSVKDFGAKGDGVTDDTAALNAACAAMRGTFRVLNVPAGVYVYNGTGLLVDNFILRGEGLRTAIKAHANTNDGYIISVLGFSARAEDLYLQGNVANPLMKGIKSEYNSDLGGVSGILFEDLHYGIDIDKNWYCRYENLRFRRSSGSIVLTGAHMRIGYNLRNEEVNNISFSNIWFSERQKHGLEVWCPTQCLKWTSCSFETQGESRIFLGTTSSINTFELDECYIESDTLAGGVALVEGQTVNQKIYLNNCMCRLGSSEVSFGKNISIHMNDGFYQCPNLTLRANNTRVYFYGDISLNFKDQFSPAQTGLWDGSAFNTHAMHITPRMQTAYDFNSLIPTYVNYKTHTNVSPLSFFEVYIPAGSGNREMMLELNILTKSVSENYTLGLEKYMVGITLPQAASAGTGVFVAKIFGAAKDGAGMFPDTSITVTDAGYDAASDSAKYIISHTVNNATRLGRTTMTLQGTYVRNELSTQTEKWRVRRV